MLQIDEINTGTHASALRPDNQSQLQQIRQSIIDDHQESRPKGTKELYESRVAVWKVCKCQIPMSISSQTQTSHFLTFVNRHGVMSEHSQIDIL